MYNELDEETLKNIINQISDWSNENENTVIVIDDFATSLKNKAVTCLINQIAANRRHYKTSIILSVQWLNSIAFQIHKQNKI